MPGGVSARRRAVVDRERSWTPAVRWHRRREGSMDVRRAGIVEFDVTWNVTD